MVRVFAVFFFCFTVPLFSQNLSGIITDEEQNPLSAVLVFNVQSEKKSYSNIKGEFTIEANANDELRFVRYGFERNFKKVKQQDFREPLKIELTRNVAEIEEVKINHQPTGDLVNDAKNLGDTKATAQLKAETVKYLRSQSTPEVLAAKPGEFVQPVGPGFTIGGPNNQWDEVDFMQFLIGELGETFFITDLNLKASEIQPFIYYIFRNFDRKEILFNGAATTADVARFISESNRKLEPYRQNQPNEPPKKNRRRK